MSRKEVPPSSALYHHVHQRRAPVARQATGRHHLGGPGEEQRVGQREGEEERMLYAGASSTPTLALWHRRGQAWRTPLDRPSDSA